MSDHDHHHHDHSHEIHPHQLEPPHEVFHDPKAGEVARIWISNGNLTMSLACHGLRQARYLGPCAGRHRAAGGGDDARKWAMARRPANFDAIRKTLNEDLGKVAGQLSALNNKA